MGKTSNSATPYSAPTPLLVKCSTAKYDCTEDSTDVLIVDDDNLLSEIVQAYLETEGFRVHRACNGAEGLMMAEKLHPKIMLLDFQMPVLDGLETLQILRQKNTTAELPVVFTSADRNVSRYADLFPHTTALSKPFDLLKLTHLVQERCQLFPRRKMALR